MTIFDQGSRLMTAAELNLCVGLMGRGDWDDFPMMKLEQPLEQQMIDSVLRLERAGCVVWDQDRWKLTEEISDIFSCVAWPQTVYRFQNQVSSPKILYCRDEYGIILEQAFGELQMGRITKVPDADPEELLMKSILEEAEDEPLWNRNALRLLFLDSNTGRHYPYAKSVLFIESEDGKQREFCFFYEDGILKAADSEGKEFNYSRERIFG